MRRRTFRSALALACATMLVLAWASTGQTDDGKIGEVTIRPNWKVGDEFRYERVKTRRRTAGKQSASATARGPIDVRVVEANEKGFLVRWRINETTPDDPKQAADPNVRAMSRLVEGLEIDIELDKDATITGIRNWAEMKASAARIVDGLMKGPKPAGADAKAIEAARAAVEGMFATRERTEQMFLIEPVAFFFPIGQTYAGVGKTREYDDKLPNPLGGPPFPCKGKVTLTAHDAATGRAEISWTITGDPKETARIVLETMNAIAKKTGRTLPNADDFKTLAMETRTEVVIDTRTGWVERFTSTRSTSGQGSTQEDILSMTRITKPK